MLNLASNFNILNNDLIGYPMMPNVINMHNTIIQLFYYTLSNTLSQVRIHVQVRN
jgi:hypothetical protein